MTDVPQHEEIVAGDIESILHQLLDVIGNARPMPLSASANSFIASKYVREIARFGGDVSSMVPEGVVRRLAEKYT